MDSQIDPRVEKLFKAIETNDLRIVGSLLAVGADPNGLDYSDGYTPLGLAVEQGKSHLVKMMLQAGANPNLGGIVPCLLEAATNENLELLVLLLEHGANPDQEDEEGESLRKWAQRNNSEHLLRGCQKIKDSPQWKEGHGES